MVRPIHQPPRIARPRRPATARHPRAATSRKLRAANLHRNVNRLAAIPRASRLIRRPATPSGNRPRPSLRNPEQMIRPILGNPMPARPNGSAIRKRCKRFVSSWISSRGRRPGTKPNPPATQPSRSAMDLSRVRPIATPARASKPLAVKPNNPGDNQVSSQASTQVSPCPLTAAIAVKTPRLPSSRKRPARIRQVRHHSPSPRAIPVRRPGPASQPPRTPRRLRPKVNSRPINRNRATGPISRNPRMGSPRLRSPPIRRPHPRQHRARGERCFRRRLRMRNHRHQNRPHRRAFLKSTAGRQPERWQPGQSSSTDSFR